MTTESPSRAIRIMHSLKMWVRAIVHMAGMSSMWMHKPAAMLIVKRWSVRWMRRSPSLINQRWLDLRRSLHGQHLRLATQQNLMAQLLALMKLLPQKLSWVFLLKTSTSLPMLRSMFARYLIVEHNFEMNGIRILHNGNLSNLIALPFLNV